MYLLHVPGNRDGHTLLQGLANDAPDPELQESLAAIRAALELNPWDGYKKGTRARKQLEDAFESVPPPFAGDVMKLLEGKGRLARLFRHRLASATRLAMYGILFRIWEKHMTT